MGKPTGAHVFGPLQPFVDGFLVELIELGYSYTTQVCRLRLMAELSAWMGMQGIEANELTVSLISGFLVSLRARGPKRDWFSPTSERQLLDHLRRLGLVAWPEPAVVSDPVELLVGRFVEYLVRERGLSDASRMVWEYRRTARLFLTGRLGRDSGGLDQVRAGDVTQFVLAECRHRSRRMSVALVSTLKGPAAVSVSGGTDAHRLDGRCAEGRVVAVRVVAEGAPVRACGEAVGELRSHDCGGPS